MRHFRLLSQLPDDDEGQPAAASASASASAGPMASTSIVFAHGDSVGERRSAALLSASPAAGAIPPPLLDWLREGEQHLLSLLSVPGLPLPEDASSGTVCEWGRGEGGESKEPRGQCIFPSSFISTQQNRIEQQ
jgi:hypothetical protein